MYGLKSLRHTSCLTVSPYNVLPACMFTIIPPSPLPQSSTNFQTLNLRECDTRPVFVAFPALWTVYKGSRGGLECAHRDIIKAKSASSEVLT